MRLGGIIVRIRIFRGMCGERVVLDGKISRRVEIGGLDIQSCTQYFEGVSVQYELKLARDCGHVAGCSSGLSSNCTSRIGVTTGSSEGCERGAKLQQSCSHKQYCLKHSSAYGHSKYIAAHQSPCEYMSSFYLAPRLLQSTKKHLETTLATNATNPLSS